MIQVFISYAHKDADRLADGLQQLQTLAREYSLKIWQDVRHLRAGGRWHQDIQKAVSDSDIYLLIVSHAYLASDYIKQHELPAIHRSWSARSALVVPIIWEDCLWKTLFKDFRQDGDITDSPLQALPSNSRGDLKPVRKWSPIADGWHACCKKLDEQIPQFLESKPRLPDPSPGRMELTPNGFKLEGTLADTGAPLTPAAQTLLDDLIVTVERVAPLCPRIGNADRHLADEIMEYRKQLHPGIGEINATLLWTNGNRLIKRIGEADPKTLEKRLDEDAVRTLVGDLQSIADVHSALLMQTEDGRKLISDTMVAAQASERTRQSSAARTKGLLQPLASEAGLFEPETQAILKIAGDALDGPANAASLASAAHLGTLTLAGFGKVLDPLAENAIATGHPASPDAINAEGQMADLISQTLETVQSLQKQIQTFAGAREELRRYTNWLVSGLEGKAPKTTRRKKTFQSKALSQVEMEKRAAQLILKGKSIPEAWRSQIRSIDLDHSQVADITPLTILTNLQTLHLSATAVSDLSPLTPLTNLQTLELNSTAVSDITPLSALANLRVLDLSSTAVSDISSLTTLTKLQTLFLSSTTVRNISALTALAKIQRLYLDATNVDDITALTELTELRTLDLRSTAVSDVRPLATLVNLQTLYLNDTAVYDIKPLAALTSLLGLDLSFTAISDVTSLSELANLQILYLNATAVREIAPLAALTSLYGLDLSATAVNDITPLVALTSLQALDLCTTSIDEITSLCANKSLKTLNFSKSKLTTAADSWPSNLQAVNLYKTELPLGSQLPDVPRMITTDGTIFGEDLKANNPQFRLWIDEMRKERSEGSEA